MRSHPVQGRRKGEKEGRAKGREQGALEETRAAVRLVFQTRGFLVSTAEKKQLSSCMNLTHLHHWLRAALTSPTVAAALQTPAKPRGSRKESAKREQG